MLRLRQVGKIAYAITKDVQMLTVEQLIEQLKEANPKAEVRIGTRSHRTVGKKIDGVWHGSNYVEIFPE